MQRHQVLQMVFDRPIVDGFKNRFIFLTINRRSSSGCSTFNANVQFKSQRNEEMMFLKQFSF